MITKEQVLEIKDGLREAYLESNLEKFNELAYRFLEGIGARFASDSEPGFTYTSSVTQEPSFKLAATRVDEMDGIFSRAKKSQEVWGKLPVKTRQLFLKLLQEEMAKYAEHFELAVSLDMGKSVQASGTELVKANEWCRWAVAPAVRDSLFVVTDRAAGKRIDIDQPFPSDISIDLESRKPLGVITGMTSANYPLGLFMGPFVSALITGSTYIYKAGDKTPSVSYIMQKVVKDTLNKLRSEVAGDVKVRKIFNGALTDDAQFFEFAEGVFAVVQGLGREKEIGERIIKDGDHFIFIGGGFGHVAHKMRKEVGKGDKTTTELGGMATCAVMNGVFEDVIEDGKVVEKAIDKSKLVKDLYKAQTDNSGQRCTGLRALFLQEGKAFDQILPALEELYKNEFSIGNPFDKNVQQGPMIYSNGDEYLDKYIPLFKALSAQEIGGGKMQHNDGFPQACLRRPSLIVWSKEALNDPKVFELIVESEAFCAITHVFPCEALDQAIKFDKQLKYRLAASVYTNDPEDVAQMREAALFGEFSVKLPPKDLSPISGHGGATVDSGKGRLGGRNTLIELTEPGESTNLQSSYLAREAIRQETGVVITSPAKGA